MRLPRLQGPCHGGQPMPMPFTYRHATDEWRRFLKNMRERTLIDSDNVIYTALEGLFVSFRQRVPPQQVLRFADELPAMMRAILLSHWDIEAPLKPWIPPEEIEREILTFRRDHNFANAGILDDLIWGIRREIRQIDFDRVLAGMDPQAQILWQPRE